MDPNAVLAIVSGVLQIVARHQAENPGAPPLTDVEVHARLLRDLEDGQSTIAQEFAAKGWTLPK